MRTARLGQGCSSVGSAPHSPQWAERFISSHECWSCAVSPPPPLALIPFFFSFQIFLSSPVSTFISCHRPSSEFPSVSLSDVQLRGTNQTRYQDKDILSPVCLTASPGCLGRLCTLSYPGPTDTPPALVKSGCLCCLSSESWCWLWLLRASGGTSSLTSPVTHCR